MVQMLISTAPILAGRSPGGVVMSRAGAPQTGMTSHQLMAVTTGSAHIWKRTLTRCQR